MPTLRPYQTAGVDFLRGAFADDHARVRFLCDEMGLGKTPQAVAALPGAPWGEPEAATLVICPAGLRTVWRRHVEVWRPDLRATVVRTTRDLRAPRIGEALIVSPDALGWAGARRKESRTAVADAEAKVALMRLRLGLVSAGWRTVVVIDEAHKLKGADAQRAVTVGEMLRPIVALGATVWALTGTPAPRDAADILCLATRFGAERHPGFFGGTGAAGWSAWARGRQRRPGKWEFAGPPSVPLDHPAAMGSILLRRLVAHHLPEIPAPTHAIRLVSIRDELRSEADEIMRAACRSLGVDPRWVERDAVTGPDDVDDALLKELGRMDHGAIAKLGAAIAEAKTPVVMDEVAACIEDGTPVVVYSEHRHAIDMLAKMGHPVVVGGMSQRKRDAAVDLFQDGDAAAFGFTGAGREGLTLTRAAKFIEADTNWSAGDRAQAIGRCVRFGQENAVSVLHVLADHPIERLKMRTLHRKRRFTIAALGSSF